MLCFYLACLAGLYFLYRGHELATFFSFPSPSNKKINFNAPNAVDSSSNHMNNQKEYWIMQNKLAMAKNSIRGSRAGKYAARRRADRNRRQPVHAPHRIPSQRPRRIPI